MRRLFACYATLLSVLIAWLMMGALIVSAQSEGEDEQDAQTRYNQGHDLAYIG